MSRSDTSYWIAKRRAEDAALIARSEAAWRARAELEAAADSESPVFVSGGHYLTLPASEGDARGLRRAIAPQCDHDRIDALVRGYHDSPRPSDAQPLVVDIDHTSGGLCIDVMGQTGLLDRRLLGRPPAGEGDQLIAALLSLTRQYCGYCRGKNAVVVLTSYTRQGDLVGSRRLGVIDDPAPAGAGA